AQPAIAPLVAAELAPGPDVKNGEEISAVVTHAGNSMDHGSGPCKRGREDVAVVDSELRVHGLDGLYVDDASVMPRMPSGNTNAPTIMIAEKASEMILSHQLK